MQAARDAEAKQLAAEQEKDDEEATANRTLAAYCHMMAERALRGIFDEPDTHMSFFSFDERIGTTGTEQRQARTFDEVDAAVSGEVVAADVPPKKTMRDIALNGAMATLTPREQEVASIHHGAGVKRKDARQMEGGIALMTHDTHIRNVNAKWRRVRTVAERVF